MPEPFSQQVVKTRGRIVDQFPALFYWTFSLLPFNLLSRATGLRMEAARFVESEPEVSFVPLPSIYLFLARCRLLLVGHPMTSQKIENCCRRVLVSSSYFYISVVVLYPMSLPHVRGGYQDSVSQFFSPVFPVFLPKAVTSLYS